MTERHATYRVDNTAVTFTATGCPIPKQSFRVGKNGGYTDPRVTRWQDNIAAEAHQAMYQRDVMEGPVEVYIDFYLPDRRRRDIDNLSKAVLDACNGIVWQDDQQIVSLHLNKYLDSPELGVTVQARKINGTATHD